MTALNLSFISGLKLKGICCSELREKLIEEAIIKLQTIPEDAFKSKYMAIKNYASFGDQREDHPYGTGPRHGTTVFSIGRGKNYNPQHADMYINILMLFRDDKGFENGHYNKYSNTEKRFFNLQETYEKYLATSELASKLKLHLNVIKERHTQ